MTLSPQQAYERAQKGGDSVIGWEVDRAQRQELLLQFEPRYGNVVADHVTLAVIRAADDLGGGAAGEGSILPHFGGEGDMVGDDIAVARLELEQELLALGAVDFPADHAVAALVGALIGLFR